MREDNNSCDYCSAPNRFLKGAMTERLSSWDSGKEAHNFEARGIPSKNLINVYRRWGEGSLGNILTGNIMIEFDQLEAAGNLIIPRSAPFKGERFDAFKEMATESKKHGSLIIGQVSHPGRQVEERIQKDPISASDVQLAVRIPLLRSTKILYQSCLGQYYGHDLRKAASCFKRRNTPTD